MNERRSARRAGDCVLPGVACGVDPGVAGTADGSAEAPGVCAGEFVALATGVEMGDAGTPVAASVAELDPMGEGLSPGPALGASVACGGTGVEEHAATTASARTHETTRWLIRPNTAPASLSHHPDATTTSGP